MDSNILIYNAEGEKRTVGFELEFAGVKLEEAAQIIQHLYGGEVIKHHRYQYKVKETELGTFRVELDARNLRRMAKENSFKKWGIDFEEASREYSIEGIVDRLAQTVVPLEVVMPPVAIDHIEILEQLRSSLHGKKAEGTTSSLMHAFGMHINIECPTLDSHTMLQYLRAFMLLYPWLNKKLEIDLSRKVTPFVDRFPEEYVEVILDPAYAPSMQQLIADYLQHNPTRNRPLDMMPIWAMEAPEQVKKALGDEKNAPRPTFHYRMPNSLIDNPEWRFSTEMGYWMQVELLAARAEMIQKLSKLYSLQKSRTMIPFQKHWVETITILLDLDEQ